MGNEQSLGESRLGFQRDRDDDFRSCTTSKPIGTDSTQNSPRLLVKNKLASKNLPITKIVVVTEGLSEDDGEQQLKNALNIPICYPIIPINGNPMFTCQADMKGYRLNPKHLTEFCLRYQEHLKLCSERVTSDQNALCSRIKEVEALILNQYTSLMDKRNKFAKYAEQMQKVNDMHSALGRIHNTLENTLKTLEQVNEYLPESERLEHLTMKKLIPAKTTDRTNGVVEKFR